MFDIPIVQKENIEMNRQDLEVDLKQKNVMVLSI